MMYGQMTAGSWIYIGTQGILQGTYATFTEVANQHFGGTLAGTDHPDRRARRDGWRPAAGRDRQRRRRAVHRGRPVARRSAGSSTATSTRSPTPSTTGSPGSRRPSGTGGRCRSRWWPTAPTCCPSWCAAAGRRTSSPTRPRRTTRSTATCRNGMSLEEALELRAAKPAEYVERSRRVDGRALPGDGRPAARRCGRLRLRQRAARPGAGRGLRRRVLLPGLRARLHPAAVRPRRRPVPLGLPVRLGGRPRRDRRGGAQGLPGRRPAAALGAVRRGEGEGPGAAVADLLARLRRAARRRAGVQRPGRPPARSRRRW